MTWGQCHSKAHLLYVSAPVSPLSTPLPPSGWLETPTMFGSSPVLRTSPSQPQTFSRTEVV